MTNDKQILINLIKNSLKESPVIIDTKTLENKTEEQLKNILTNITQN
jgi:hypothetical protein